MAGSGPMTLIYQDNPGALPGQYILPDTIELTIQSIVARVDGSAAAGSFLPTLSILSQDGKLIGRVPSDVTYAVGDTGVVTWSPFLRRVTTGGSTTVTAETAGVVTSGSFSIPDSTLTDISSHMSSAFESGNDVFITTFGVHPQVRVLQSCGLVVNFWVQWASDFAGNRYLQMTDSAGGGNWTPVTTGLFLRGSVATTGQYDSFSFVALASSGFPWDFVPKVFQSSGVAQSITSAGYTVLTNNQEVA